MTRNVACLSRMRTYQAPETAYAGWMKRNLSHPAHHETFLEGWLSKEVTKDESSVALQEVRNVRQAA